MPLSLVEWSADAGYILFGAAGGECHAYDMSGNAVGRVPIYCNESFTGELMMVMDLCEGAGGQ